MLITVNGKHFRVLGIVMCRIRSRSEMYKFLSWKLIENQNKKGQCLVRYYVATIMGQSQTSKINYFLVMKRRLRTKQFPGTYFEKGF